MPTRNPARRTKTPIDRVTHAAEWRGVWVIDRLAPIRRRHAWATRYRGLLHAGNRVECPCCGGRFRGFKDDRGRPDAICPRCLSQERHRVLARYLKDCTDVYTGDHSVLHVAPEATLQEELRRRPRLRYLSADLDSPLAMERMDICDIQYPDDSFDVILCLHVLEHVPDDVRAMRELLRVLRPNGWAILQVPLEVERATTFEDPDATTPEARLAAYGQDDHVRAYGRDFPDRLREAGFSVVADPYARDLSPALVARNGLRWPNDIYLCWTGEAEEPPLPRMRALLTG